MRVDAMRAWDAIVFWLCARLVAGLLSGEVLEGRGCGRTRGNMKHMKTVTVPARTREEVDRVTCDLCGAVVNEEPEEFHHDRVRIDRDKGTHYPEGGIYDITEYDVCPACWEGKLEPFFASFGAVPRKKEIMT